MLQDTLTLYKLIVLYMLNRVTFPLTAAQVRDFMLDRDYTNFLTLQQVFAELTDAGMLTSQTMGNRTQLTLTEEGVQTLHYFDNRISPAIKQEIDTYLRENEMTLRNEVSVQSRYYKSTSGEYETNLIAKDRDITLVNLTLSVPTEEIARTICENWQRKNESIYQYLVQELF